MRVERPLPRPTAIDRAEPSTILVVGEREQESPIAQLLESTGFDVRTAVDGKAAVDVAHRNGADLLIFAETMTETVVFGTVEMLRRDPVLETLPTLVVGDDADQDARLRGFASGVDGFIAESADGGDVIARVRALLRIASGRTGRVSSTVAALRRMRRRIVDAEHGRTPREMASGLIDRFPPELTCSSVVALDHGGATSWFGRQDSVVVVERCGIDSDSVPAGLITIGSGDSDDCPLCGTVGAGSAVSIIGAGSWSGGAALLLVGCPRMRPVGSDELITEVAEASAPVVSKWMREWPIESRFERWLARLVETSAFDVWFQPIVDMRSGSVVAHEALARFDDGSLPTQVFEMASTMDRAVALELALAETAITAAASLPDGARLHVNVSPLAAVAPELSGLVDRADRRVVLEISERQLFDAAAATHLRATLPIGSLLAADDVGAGYSGMSQLLDVRPDILKIDRAIVVGLDKDPARQALVAGLVRFAESTGSTIVGEGVERAAEARSLLELGVSIGQGYYFSRPRPLEQVSSNDAVPGPVRSCRGSPTPTQYPSSASIDLATRRAILRAQRRLETIDESYVPSDEEIAASAGVTTAQARRVLAQYRLAGRGRTVESPDRTGRDPT